MTVSESSIRQRPPTDDPAGETLPEADHPDDATRTAVAIASAPATHRRWLLTVPGVALLLAWMYAVTVHANSAAVNSDGATVILQGRAVASGNVLLHGWILSLDSWWTLDVAVLRHCSRR